MNYKFNLPLEKERIKYILDKSGMVYKEEWSELFPNKSDGISRLEVLDPNDLDSFTMDLVKDYWVGCDESNIDIGIMYNVDVEDQLLIIHFKFYQTYVEGFQFPILFPVTIVNDSLLCLLEEWKSEFSNLHYYLEEVVQSG